MKKVYCLKGSKEKCPRGYIKGIAQDGSLCKNICTTKTYEKRFSKKIKRKLKSRKHKVHKHKTRKYKVHKHKTRKYKVRKHKVRKHKVRKHKVRKRKTRKRKGGGEGQPQESQSDCALTCEKYTVGDKIIYRRYRMGVGNNDITGKIIKIGKPSNGRNIGVCCYTIETIGLGGRTFHSEVDCDDPSIRRPRQDAPEPVRRGGPGRRGPNNKYGLNEGINPQQ